MKIKLSDESRFSEGEKRVFSLLEEDPFFEWLVMHTRNEIRIPKEGLANEAMKNNLSAVSKRKVLERVSALLSQFNFNQIYWTATFVNIILLDIATPPLKEKYPPIEIKHIFKEVHIVIRETTGAEEIVKFIKDKNNRSLLKKALSLVPKPKDTKVRNIELYKRLLSLEKEGLSDDEIADILSNEMENDITYDEVCSQRNRFKDYVRKLSAGSTIPSWLLKDVIAHQ